MGCRSKVVQAAKSQIGVCEPSGDDIYLKWFNQAANANLPMDASWCACFVSWCLRQGGVPTSVFGNFAQCSVALSWAKSKNIWHSRLTSHRPKSGELILFDWDSDGKADHIGLIESATVNNITTIEGNAKGGETVDGVRRKTYSTTSKYIKGYIDIPYPDEAATVAVDHIKPIQTFLNKTYQEKLDVDGEWGPLSKKAMIRSVQTELNKTTAAKLAVDGIWGAKTKAAFPDFSMSARGNMVSLIQGCLIAAGADIEFDGVFGSATKAAVKSFQSAHKLACDGIVGKNTMTQLVK